MEGFSKVESHPAKFIGRIYITSHSRKRRRGPGLVSSADNEDARMMRERRGSRAMDKLTKLSLLDLGVKIFMACPWAAERRNDRSGP